jgi:replication factor C subunit 2/4
VIGHAQGYSALDVVGTLFRVCKSAELPEHLKLEFSKQIGFCHMRAAEGVNSMLQLDGLLAKLCRTASAAGSATTA